MKKKPTFFVIVNNNNQMTCFETKDTKEVDEALEAFNTVKAEEICIYQKNDDGIYSLTFKAHNRKIGF